MLTILLAVAVLLGFLYVGRGYVAWVGGGAVVFLGWTLSGIGSPVLFVLCLAIFVSLAVIFGSPARRRALVTHRLFPVVGRMLPRLGDTERIALEAGTVWWDGELFSGNPDWRKLGDFRIQPLSDEERAFLEGPVEELCGMVHDDSIGRAQDLPPEVWAYIKTNKFFGMIIPKEYGGLGFSAHAHSAVVTKLASRSVATTVTVMVPNSLGPAELLLHYGTEQQKQHWLPRLATGEEIPCFALTGPEAGSDAAATTSNGVVCRGTFEGQDVLGMRLNWNKRYITLGPVSTVIGLAFRLYDPEGLLGDQEDLGITCALIPSDLPGVEIGKRHDPLGVAFQNGPTEGHEVFVPLDCIIGGADMAGQGWRMLMETLAAGRGISLPALSVGAVELAARVVGDYALVREQFGMPIGRFEGVEEPLARIAGFAYFMNATRLLTVGAVDAGERPSVISAIVKAYLTQGMRVAVNDAMDVQAGAAICRGPRNILAHAYSAVPIGITVEGANILTRSMIIFGQGAIRCHPFAQREIEAVEANDPAAFDEAFFGHIGFVGQCAARAVVLGLTNGALARGAVAGPTRNLAGQLTRMSAAFALVSDAAMATLGGELKRREKLTGRLADAVAWQYIAAATLKRYWDDGQPQRDWPFVQWAVEHALFQIQEALSGALRNLPNRPAAWALRALVFPLGRRLAPPSDALGSAVARALLDDSAARTHLSADIYIPPPDEAGLGRLEATREVVAEALAVHEKIRDAVKANRLDRKPSESLTARAVEAGVITADEAAILTRADTLRDDIIQVDAFDADHFERESAFAGVAAEQWE